MSTDETEILEYLKSQKDHFISVIEISRRLGFRNGRFTKDPCWARPILLRLEMEGLIENNLYGEFRHKEITDDTAFMDALNREDPQICLGDTTIIRLEDVKKT